MIYQIPLHRFLDNPWQTRSEIDREHILELAIDIANNGLLQTPVGRFVDRTGKPCEPDDTLIEENDELFIQLAFGHNRLAAFKALANPAVDPALQVCDYCNQDYEKMPVNVREMSDEVMAITAWSENEKRLALSPVEQAEAIQRRIDDFSWTQEQAADFLGISRSTVANKLRLLKLPENLRKALRNGDISERQCMAVLPIWQLEPAMLADLEQAALPWAKPSGLVQEMIAGTLSSDQVRHRVEFILVEVGKKQEKIANAVPVPAPAPAPIPGPVYAPEPTQPEPSDEVLGRYDQPNPEEGMEYDGIEPPNGKSERLETLQTTNARDAARAEQEAVAAGPVPTTTTYEQGVETVAIAPKAAPAEYKVTPEPAKQPTWAESTITLTLTYWPEDGNPEGRQVAVGARINSLGPQMRFVRSGSIILPEVLERLFKELEAQFGGTKP